MIAAIGHKVLVFLLTILIFVGVPIVLILSSPFFVFRLILAKLAPCLRPKFGKMVTTRGSLFGGDDYTNCPATNVISTVLLQGQVDLERARESAGKRLLEARLPNGEVRYPELKQYVTTWAGFLFWKDDKKFDIKNHIKIHQSQERFTEDDLQQLRQNMLQEPWAKKRPLWDITLVPNYYPAGLKSPGPHTVLIIRFHHILGDGYSWSPLVFQEMFQSKLTFPEPNYPKRSFCEHILDLTTFPFRASYQFADCLSIGFLEHSPFRMKKGMPVGKYNIAVSNIIPLKKMKEIRAHFNVSFSSIVTAVLAGAIRDLIISKRMKTPSVFSFFLAQPLPGHSLKLRNYYTGIILKYPVGEADPVKRLKYCDTNYKCIQKSAQPRFFKYFMIFLGSYFSWMIKYLGQNQTVSSSVSNFPGPAFDLVHFNGHKLIDLTLFTGLQKGANGLGFIAISFLDSFRISSMAATGILSKEEVNELSVLICKHMDILHERVITDV